MEKILNGSKVLITIRVNMLGGGGVNCPLSTCTYVVQIRLPAGVLTFMCILLCLCIQGGP